MSLVNFLLKGSRCRILTSATFGTVSGLAASGVIALVHPLVAEGTANRLLIGAFISLALLAVVSKAVSEVSLIRLGQSKVAELRLRLCRSIASAPLEQVEGLGAPRLLATLNDDVAALSQAFVHLPIAFVNAATVLGCLVYLAWLSPVTLGTVLVIMLFGTVIFEVQSRKATRGFIRARDASDLIFVRLEGLIDGIKELKLDRLRRLTFLNQHLSQGVARYEEEFVAGSTKFSIAMGWGGLFFYVALGATIVMLPALGLVDVAQVLPASLALLYMMGPFAQVIEIFPTLTRAQVALNKVLKLGLTLDAEDEGEAEGSLAESQLETYRSIELVDVTHRYYSERDRGSFCVGPVNLSFRPGEIVFLIGGNGSGKTTLSKLLLGLYVPEAGQLRVDGRIVGDRTREQFRQLFTAIFSDFHVFQELVSLESADAQERARRYIKRFDLERCVKLEGSELVVGGLSQGQRKRLALIVACLDDRPFFVFDEWASDQDPIFRRIFYTELLPELRERGKTVLAINHDDQYYGVADRCVQMDLGQASEVHVGDMAAAHSGASYV